MLHLAKTMGEQLGCLERGVDPNELDNRELDRIVEEELQRGRLMLGSRTAASGTFLGRSWRWVKGNWVWTMLFGINYAAVLGMAPVVWSMHVAFSVAFVLLALSSFALFVLKVGRWDEQLAAVFLRKLVIAKGFLSFTTRWLYSHRPGAGANTG